MKKSSFLRLVMAVALLLTVNTNALGDNLRLGGSIVGKIESNGDVRIGGSIVGRFEANGDIRVGGSIVGRIEKNGDIRKNGSIIGRVEQNNDVRISGSIVGRVEKNGDIRKNGSIIGRAEQMTDVRRVAVMYFFPFFKLHDPKAPLVSYQRCFFCAIIWFRSQTVIANFSQKKSFFNSISTKLS